MVSSLITRSVTACGLGVAFLFMYFYVPPFVISALLAAIAAYTIFFEWPQFKLWWLTPFYPLLGFIALITLNQMASSLLLLLVVIVSGHDSGAYLVGTFWGRHRLCPAISPKKTWEGVIGGSVVSGLIFWLILPYLNCTINTFAFFLITILLNSGAVAGDLFESYLKRRVRIKDSGKILPGHGGILDRLDSILLCAVLLLALVALSDILVCH